jgi:hypothetical protein
MFRPRIRRRRYNNNAPDLQQAPTNNNNVGEQVLQINENPNKKIDKGPTPPDNEDDDDMS